MNSGALRPGQAYLVKFCLQGGAWNRFYCAEIVEDTDRTTFRMVQTRQPTAGANNVRVIDSKVLVHSNSAFYATACTAPRWFQQPAAHEKTSC